MAKNNRAYEPNTLNQIQHKIPNRAAFFVAIQTVRESITDEIIYEISIGFLFQNFFPFKNCSVSDERNITSDSIGGSPPASSNSTFQSGFSLNRLATTDPAL